MSERYIFMPDKIMRSGNAPIYNEKNQLIARIHYYYFSFRGRIEIKDPTGNLLSKGQLRPFGFTRNWTILDASNQKIGNIKQHITFFYRSYTYTNAYGEKYKIEGNLRARNFKMTKNGKLAMEIVSQSEFFTMRPHSYGVRILDDRISTVEAMNVVEGIRSLVEINN